MMMPARTAVLLASASVIAACTGGSGVEDPAVTPMSTATVAPATTMATTLVEVEPTVESITVNGTLVEVVDGVLTLPWVVNPGDELRIKVTFASGRPGVFEVLDSRVDFAGGPAATDVEVTVAIPGDLTAPEIPLLVGSAQAGVIGFEPGDRWAPVITIENTTGVTGDVTLQVRVSDLNGTDTIQSLAVMQEFNFQHPDHAEGVIARAGTGPISIRDVGSGATEVSFDDSRFDFVFTADKEITEYVSNNVLAPIDVITSDAGIYEMRFNTEWPGRHPLRITAADSNGNATTRRIPIEIYWSQQPLDLRGVMIDIHWDDDSLDEARRLFPALAEEGVNLITLNPILYMESIDATEVRLCPPAWTPIERCSTPTYEDLQVLVEMAHDNGLQVAMKPHFIIDGYAIPGWRMAPADWDLWFESYAARLVEIAALGEFEYLSVGNELGPSHARTGNWADLIAELRTITNAELTYSDPNAWTGEWPGSPRVRFWDELDLVGAPFYYPGSRTNADPAGAGDVDPTAERMQDLFQKQIEDLLVPTVNRHNKPVIFLELGISNFDGANMFPANTEYTDEMTVDNQEWVEYYEAALRTVASYEWTSGTVIWSAFLLDGPFYVNPEIPITHDIWHGPVRDVMRIFYHSDSDQSDG